MFSFRKNKYVFQLNKSIRPNHSSITAFSFLHFYKELAYVTNLSLKVNFGWHTNLPTQKNKATNCNCSYKLYMKLWNLFLNERNTSFIMKMAMLRGGALAGWRASKAHNCHITQWSLTPECHVVMFRHSCKLLGLVPSPVLFPTCLIWYHMQPLSLGGSFLWDIFSSRDLKTLAVDVLCMFLLGSSWLSPLCHQCPFPDT